MFFAFGLLQDESVTEVQPGWGAYENYSHRQLQRLAKKEKEAAKKTKKSNSKFDGTHAKRMQEELEKEIRAEGYKDGELHCDHLMTVSFSLFSLMRVFGLLF